MWISKLLLAGIGWSAGCIVAGGLCSFIVELGVISDLADRTHTGHLVLRYEECLALGAFVGTVVWIYGIRLPFGEALAGAFGLLGGIFVGCWAMALAEMLNVFPIFIRKVRLNRYVSHLILGIALGKGFGAFLFFVKRW